jgi:hypothetical protein
MRNKRCRGVWCFACLIPEVIIFKKRRLASFLTYQVKVNNEYESILLQCEIPEMPDIYVPTSEEERPLMT